MDYLVITLPGQTAELKAPAGVPTGGIDKLGQILGDGLGIFIMVVVIVTLFIIVQSGIQWTTSGGDKQKLQSARLRLTWSVVGLLITLLTFFIINGLGSLFGINLLEIGK